MHRPQAREHVRVARDSRSCGRVRGLRPIDAPTLLRCVAREVEEQDERTSGAPRGSARVQVRQNALANLHRDAARGSAAPNCEGEKLGIPTAMPTCGGGNTATALVAIAVVVVVAAVAGPRWRGGGRPLPGCERGGR